MAFLPIAERELRLASRSKGIYRIRVWTTLAGVLVSFFFMLAFTVQRHLTGRGAFNLGEILFTLLTYYAYGLSLLAGVVLASDCISVEKREGTLGLLFLTDLKGYDVVFGKLASVGLSALYGLVAVLPIIALPLLMGGVTGGEFWRVSLALVNTLFFALATGILVSTFSRENSAAMMGTVGVLLLTAIALPFLGFILSAIHLPANWWYFTSFSPANPFRFGAESRYIGGAERYWYSLLTSHLVAWCMLIVASWTLPHVWQDKPMRLRRVEHKPARSHARRARLLDENPIAWLAEKNPGMLWWAWAVPIAGVGITASILLINQSVWTYAATSTLFFALIFILKIIMAFQASRFFVEARRSGALEMIFSTPVTAQEIIEGQWLVMKRFFLWPVIVLLTLQLGLSMMTYSASTQFVNFKLMTAPNTFPLQMQTFLAKWPFLLMTALSQLYKALKSAMDFWALGWLGMWFGLSFKKPNLAVGMNILIVLIIAKLVICIPDPVIDFALYFWASNKLKEELRRLVPPQTLLPLYSTSSAPAVAPQVIR